MRLVTFRNTVVVIKEMKKGIKSQERKENSKYSKHNQSERLAKLSIFQQICKTGLTLEGEIQRA